MERFAFALAIASTGCHVVFALEDKVPGDANNGGDDGSDAGDDDLCFGTGDIKVCPAAVLPDTLDLTGPFDTDGDECLTLDPANAEICAVGATTLAIGALRPKGVRPIVIVGDLVTITSVDVSSSRMFGVGAGNRKACPPFETDPATTTSVGSAGGSHGRLGGAGGMNVNNVPGGQPGAIPPGGLLLGGCSGQNKGSSLGGAGGGAVAVLARTRVSITGSINASGAGGAQGAASSSGAGGGAGGMIYLDSPMIDLVGQVFANGGGGGEGAEVVSVGMPGRESPSATIGGAGGTGGGVGADGGFGGYQDNEAAMGNKGQSGVGAGGGGGAVGVIRMIPTVVGQASNVSPPATP